MKQVLTSLLFFFTLNLSAQYKLEIGFGYNYPRLDFIEGYSEYRFEQAKFFGYYGNLGFTREIDSLFSHSFGVGFVNRNVQNTSVFNPEINLNNDTSIINSHYVFGNTQLYYLFKIHPYKKIRLSFDIGLSFERQLYRLDRTNDLAELSWNRSMDFTDLLGNFGLSYSFKLSEKVELYTQASISKSVIQFGYSAYNPVKGTIYAPLDFRLKLGATLNIFKEDFLLKKRLKKNREVERNRNKKIVRQYVSMKAGYIFKQRELGSDFNNNSINESVFLSYPSYWMNVETYFSESHGLQLGFAYCQERFYFPFEVDISYNILKMKTLEYVTANFGHSTPWGYSMYQNTYSNFFQANNLTLTHQIGIGFKLFRPTSKFNIIPVFKIQPTFVLTSKVKENYTIRTDYYGWNQNTPGPIQPGYSTDSTYVSNIFGIQRAYVDLTLGSVINYKITPNLVIETEFGIGIKKTYTVQSIANNLHDRMRFFASIALAHTIKLKDKLNDPYGF